MRQLWWSCEGLDGDLPGTLPCIRRARGIPGILSICRDYLHDALGVADAATFAGCGECEDDEVKSSLV